jgi:peptide/nickel transport system substrate-binding protein
VTLRTPQRTRIRVAAIAASSLTAVALLAACAGTGPDSGPDGQTDVTFQDGGTLTVGITGEPGTLDPMGAFTLASISVFNSMCERVFTTTQDNELVPQLATDLPEFNDDFTAATVKLREDVVFQDGTPFDAEAVAFGLERNKSGEGTQRAGELLLLDTVDVVDEFTVQLNFTGPATLDSAGNMLSSRAGIMVSPTAVEEAGSADEFALNPVCVGPFQFESRVPQDNVTLSRADNYYAPDTVHLDEIIYRIIPDSTVRLTNLRAGDLDVIERVSPRDVATVEADSGLSHVNLPGNGFYDLKINTAVAPFDDPLVRRALEMSINKDAISETVFAGLYPAACGFTSPNHRLFTDAAAQCGEYDPDAAIDLIEQSGVETPIRGKLTLANNQEWLQMAQTIQAMAAEVGFDLEIAPGESTAVVAEARAGNYNMNIAQWSGSYNLGDNVQPVESNAFNYMNYTNPEVEALYRAALSEPDDDARAAIYGEITAILDEDKPTIYLVHPSLIHGFSAQVAGLEYDPGNTIKPAHAGFIAS